MTPKINLFTIYRNEPGAPAEADFETLENLVQRAQRRLAYELNIDGLKALNDAKSWQAILSKVSVALSSRGSLFAAYLVEEPFEVQEFLADAVYYGLAEQAAALVEKYVPVEIEQGVTS